MNYGTHETHSFDNGNDAEAQSFHYASYLFNIIEG